MTTDTVGGIWNYSLELSRALGVHNVEVLLATMGGRLSPEQRAAALSLRNVTVRESDFRLEWMADPWADVDAAGEWLLDIAASIRPDVVHVNGYAHAQLPFGAPVLVVAHSCVLSWWRAVHGCDAPAGWTRYADVVRRGLAAAAAVAAPTRALLNELQTLYGGIDRSVVIPNGVRQPPARRRMARESFVLAAGRVWDEAKNIETLNLAARDVPWSVRVAGSTSAPDGSSRDFDAVTLLGRLGPEALQAQYSAAAVFAHPALYEPFGLAPLEAALHGCALVLADIPTLREVWNDAAVFVPPRDAAALAQAIDALMTDAARRDAIARRGFERARSFSVERMTSGYLAAYAALTYGPRTQEVTLCV